MFHNKYTNLSRRHGSSSVSPFAAMSHLGLQGQGEKKAQESWDKSKAKWNATLTHDTLV